MAAGGAAPVDHIDPDLRAALENDRVNLCADIWGANATPCQSYMRSAVMVCHFALLVIGILAVTGTLTDPSTLAYAIAGCAGGAVGFELAGGEFNQPYRSMKLIVTCLIGLTALTLAALGNEHLLTVHQVGWGLIGTVLASMPLCCCVLCCAVIKGTARNAKDIEEAQRIRNQLHQVNRDHQARQLNQPRPKEGAQQPPAHFPGAFAGQGQTLGGDASSASHGAVSPRVATGQQNLMGNLAAYQNAVQASRT